MTVIGIHQWPLNSSSQKTSSTEKKSPLLCLMAWGYSNVASNPGSNMIIPWPPQLVARKRIMLLLSKGTPTVYHSFYWSKIKLLPKFQNSNRYFDLHYCNSTYSSTIVFCMHIFQTLCDDWIYSYQVLNHIKSILYGAACHQWYIMWPNGYERQVFGTAFIFEMFSLNAVEEILSLTRHCRNIRVCVSISYARRNICICYWFKP